MANKHADPQHTRSHERIAMRRRLGLSLAEVLVILGIVALFIILAVPAVQMARENARRTTCKNNLREFGYALQTYHETYGMFPMPYMIDAGNPLFTPPYNLNAQSWGRILQPYLGGLARDQQLNFKTPCYSANGIANVNSIIARWGRPPHNAKAAVDNEMEISRTFPVFNCPATSGGPRIQKTGYVDLEMRYNIYDESAPGTKLDVTYASTDYQVLNGIADVFAQTYFTGPKQESLDGVMSRPNVCVQMRDVIDGLSETWMLAERTGANDVWRGTRKVHSISDGVFVEPQTDGKQFNIQTGGGWGDFESGDCWLAGSEADGTSPKGFGPCLINCTNLNQRGLYSFHPGLIQVLKADSSVQAVNASIETNLVVEAITRAGLKSSEQ